MSVERRPRRGSPGGANRPLVSSNTIWILSGILLGIGVTELVPPNFRISTCLGGTVGLVAYFTLQHVAKRREAEKIVRQRRLEASKLEGLVERHIPKLVYRPKRRPLQRPQTSADRQYVTVAASHRHPLQASG